MKQAKKNQNYQSLLLKNQICFPLYACARAVTRQYTPYLDAVNLTYTQYIIMMVFWEKKETTARDLGEELFLDSGTLTPVLKSLENKGLITRDPDDERKLRVTVTEKGMALRDEVVGIPEKVASCVPLDPEEAKTLYGLLYKLLGELKG